MSSADTVVRDNPAGSEDPKTRLPEILRSIYPQFNDIEDQAWFDVLKNAEVMQIPTGTLVMEPPSPCPRFLLILSGSVRVYQQTPEDREVTLYRSYPGDLCILSINGLMHQRGFGAFAKTESNVEALTLTRDQFMQAIALSTIFREYVLTNLTDRIHDVLQLVEATVFESLDTRLMCHLNRLSRTTGSDTLKLTHQDLARELGTSREVISRILKVFERQGCIIQERGIIHLDI